MKLTLDELAGVVDLFGALSCSELSRAGEELAFKRGTAFDGEQALKNALAAYHLVAFEPDDGAVTDGNVTVEDTDGTLLATGPTAFPTLPDGAEDLPHILNIRVRTLDRMALGEVVEERFRADAAQAVASEDRARVERLLDVSYDIEAWAPVELDGVRKRLDATIE